MLETGYQAKIMKGWVAIGGHNVNGTYTKNGEADLQGGWPVITYIQVSEDGFIAAAHKNIRLLYLVVEVKTEKDYYRVMECIDLVDGYYKINGKKGLKKHEPLQIAKINQVRKKGGLAVIAFSFEQVEQYVKGNT